MPTPLYIEIGLHYATKADDYRDGDFTAPAVREALLDFVSRGLLIANPKLNVSYGATEGLRVWVEALCAVEFPEQRWVVGSPQSRGGRARAEKLSPERRKEIAEMAAAARWAQS
jgi:hypothetical protein